MTIHQMASPLDLTKKCTITKKNTKSADVNLCKRWSTLRRPIPLFWKQQQKAPSSFHRSKILKKVFETAVVCDWYCQIHQRCIQEKINGWWMRFCISDDRQFFFLHYSVYVREQTIVCWGKINSRKKSLKNVI